MNLQPVHASSSKQEEIALLKEVAKLFPDGSYLYWLISDSLIGWAELQLKGDILPNIMEEVESLKTAVFKAEQLHQQMNSTANDLRNANETLSNRIENMRQDKIELQARFNELANDAKNEINAKNDLIDGLAASNDQLHNEIKRLKAEIYDLTHVVK